MTSVAAKVAVIGSGISGAVCASTLAKNGISVTLSESARGPVGRMSQRRLLTQFLDIEEEGLDKKYVGVPGMNSICKSLCQEPGVQSRFGVGVGRLDNEDSWSLMGLNGESLDYFKGVMTSDKSTFSQRFTNVTGKPVPIDMDKFPEIPLKMTEIPVNPCFALMLAFEEPLTDRLLIQELKSSTSGILRQQQTGRSRNSESWVLHSTAEYAQDVISQTGLQKPSSATLAKVAEEVFQEFQSTKLSIPQAFFKKAHRWLVSKI
ncbi:hypothetical protein K7X08_016116 [Anisodus acutangulus]|uniref:Uncharacterized protein n=1 Tax=Anisodus acutangulus TaxID=402998 RepID=A0A9Q1LGE0_9SOLA|nr:hypothetical protein K7X08_016116 [Anisodus acutangulus]